MNSLILATAARVVMAMLLIFSLYLLLRGHNEPGGGFVGGLVASSAVLLHGIANGVSATRRLIRVDPRTIAVIGIAVAAAAGFAGALVGAPFLTGIWMFPAGVPIGSPLLFDIGVYLVVFGAVTSLVLALEEET
jgi:multicomponent Na+:H+ antiporter subunit B